MYYDYYAKEWSVQVSLEEYIRSTLKVANQEITLSGKIDKLEWLTHIGSGPVRVIDYKTGKVYSQKSDKSQKESLERQIRFYHLLLRGYENGDVQVEEAVLDFVEPTDDGVFEQKTLAVGESDIKQLTEQIETMVHEVQSGEFISRGCQKKDCDACQFYNSLTTG
jgi:RecB family exonuclease